jgi:hydroxylamine reductase
MHGLRGLAMYAHRARTLGASDPQIDRFALEVLFATVTNVNFDADRLEALARELAQERDRARALYEKACTDADEPVEHLGGAAEWAPAADRESLVRQGLSVGVAARKEALGEDISSLQELMTYGVKGLAAYAHHALILGAEDDAIYAFVHEALAATTEEHSVDEWIALCLKAGEVNLKAMELLDHAHTGRYGHPEPTAVRVTPRKGKAILVSGHDLRDLEALLEQTAGTGINIYTHGEMLPAHGYPELKKHAHLAGNYGGAWQDQAKEFDAFPGAVLMTTNCIQKPRESYKGRIFTTGPVAWPGVTHVPDRGDFGEVIAAAEGAEGFAADGEDKTIMVGFGHDAVLGVADKVIDAVKSGAIKHFFLIGGCDGARTGRNYYTELAEKVPDDCVILTLACGKYRFNKLELGDIGGIPRLLDIGQCNDAYSAVQIAAALAQAFDTDVNSLPLSLVLSWYEQKAVAILLTLLHLGIRNIRIGPTLPAFVSENVLDVIVKNFNLTPITTPEQDLAAMLSG